MKNPIATYLNNTVMYRLMIQVLFSLALIATLFAFLGIVSFSGVDLLATLAVLLAVCPLVNWLFAKLLHAPVNPESSWITALILFFLVFPSVSSLATTALVGGVAMASKYILVWRRRHIFNPAAVGAVIAGLLGVPIFWWVATPYLLPFVLIGGLLILKKTRRGIPVTLFFLASIASVLVIGSLRGALPLDLLREAIFSWPIVFFGTVMLTEPMTLPSKRGHQLIEAVGIGLLFAVPFHLGPLYSSPELLLLIGNLFAFAVSRKSTVRMKLEERLEPAPGVLDLGFSSTDRPVFEAGQYVEWTLPHEHSDTRGVRRTFTVASAPQEKLFRIGVRLARENGSSFKRALAALPIGGEIFASNVGGDFTLPKDPNKKVALIAGGIGVTPFRSMAEHLVDTKTHRDAVLFYCAASPKDFVYQDVFVRAAAFGWRTVYVSSQAENLPVGWQGRTGMLTPEVIKQELPNFSERAFYLSGPSGMVNAYKKMLRGLGVHPQHIHTDYFPGY